LTFRIREEGGKGRGFGLTFRIREEGGKGRGA
jgi:hypothetical protein